MTHLKMTIDDDRCRLIEILAWHLLTSSATTLPGSDGLTVEDVVVADYRVEAEAGHVPRLEELIQQHPNLSDALHSFFNSW
jgi:hypothetical protein